MSNKCERCKAPIDEKVSWCTDIECLTERVEKAVNEQQRKVGK